MVKHLLNDLRKQLKIEGFVALHEPRFNGNEKKYVTECIETGWVSSVGKYVDKFEENLNSIVGTKKTIAIVNGTSSLTLALKIVGVGHNDEVIVPALSFVATANAVAHLGAIPNFVDVSLTTLGMCPIRLEQYLSKIAQYGPEGLINKNTGRKIKAIVPMHTFGHPVEIDAIIAIAKSFNLPVIEDSAESLGSYYNGKHTGSFGLMGAFSFNGNKLITTGGGGALCTNSESFGNLAKHLSTTAKIPHPYEFDHDHIGYNYRLPNLNAALGVGQLESLPLFLKQKRKLHSFYLNTLNKYEEFRVFSEPPNSQSNYWLINILLDQKHFSLKDEFLKESNNNGFMTRPAWKLLNQLKIYESCPTDSTDIAKILEKSIICLPSSPFLAKDL